LDKLTFSISEYISGPNRGDDSSMAVQSKRTQIKPAVVPAVMVFKYYPICVSSEGENGLGFNSNSKRYEKSRVSNSIYHQIKK
jgi:hypothetical protein